MKNIFLILFMVNISLFAEKSAIEQYGIDVKYNDGENSILIKRVRPTECRNISFTVKNTLGDNLANDEINPKCVRKYITYFGSISPMQFTDGVDTYGELEVLEFMQKASTDENLLLVDSRTENWYMHFTIPSAINIPYTFLKKSQYPEEFQEILDTLNVTKKNGKYDFENAKTLLLFCNAVWCGQSPISMQILIDLGYPKSKLKWYRAGIQGWTSLGLQTIIPQ